MSKSLVQEIIAMHRFNLQKIFMGRIDMSKTEVLRTKLPDVNYDYSLEFQLRNYTSEDEHNLKQIFKTWRITGFHYSANKDMIRFLIYIRATRR